MTRLHRRWHLALWLTIGPLLAVALFLSLLWRRGLP
jgi:hypothetical protein